MDLCIEQIFRGLHVFTREICECQVRIDPVWQHAQTIFDLSRAGGTITKAIAVCINVCVVTDTIIVRVLPLAWILRNTSPLSPTPSPSESAVSKDRLEPHLHRGPVVVIERLDYYPYRQDRYLSTPLGRQGTDQRRQHRRDLYHISLIKNARVLTCPTVVPIWHS